nr:PTS sugar transporter subunit IIA [Lacticaseibacillus saniviri]
MTLFERDNMLMTIQGTTQKEVLAELAAKAKELGIVADENQLIQDYLDREAESTTGLVMVLRFRMLRQAII